MSRRPSEKSFDCMAFKRQSQAKIYEDIKDMNNEAQREYFRGRAETGPFGEWLKKVKQRSGQRAAAVAPSRRGAGSRRRKAS